jgi:cytoskeletal protein RodZ
MTNVPFPPSDTVDDKAYDGALHEVALRAPLSFLNLTELSRSLETEFADLSNKLEAKRAELAQQLSATAETIRVKQKEDMRTDLWALIRASFVYAVLGLVVLILATQAVPWIQGLFRPNLNDIVSETVEHQLSERFLIPGAESLSSRDSQRTLENLINEVVKRQLAKRFPPAANSSAASSATKTAPSNNTPAAHPTNRTAGTP